MLSGLPRDRFPQSEIDRLLRARVLIEERKLDMWGVCPHCDCDLDARPIRQVGDELRACCPYNHKEDVILTPEDLEVFSVDPERLAAHIGASGGLVGEVVQIADGVWSIGVAPSGVAVILCSALESLKVPGTILAIRAVAAGHSVAIVGCDPDPETILRVREAGFVFLDLTEVFRTGGDGRDQLSIDIAQGSPDAVRLVIHRATQSAVLDGRRLDLPVQPFALLQLLAEQVFERDPVVATQTVEMELRRAPREIVRDLRRALVACGLDEATAESLVRSARGRGYRLGLEPSEVVIEP